MQTRHVRTLIGVLVAGLFLPFQAQAETNAELLKRIEALSQELTRLKGQVEANNAATTATAAGGEGEAEGCGQYFRRLHHGTSSLVGIRRWVPVLGFCVFLQNASPGADVP